VGKSRSVWILPSKASRVSTRIRSPGATWSRGGIRTNRVVIRPLDGLRQRVRGRNLAVRHTAPVHDRLAQPAHRLSPSLTVRPPTLPAAGLQRCRYAPVRRHAPAPAPR
jgi:hypothetical protein